MGQLTVGQLILRERKKLGVSAAALMRGIGTDQKLYDLESGQPADKQLVDILLQRLGKSPDKLEYILNWKEYRFECVRDWFEECVFRKNKKWAQRAFALYEQKASRLGAIGQMYLYRARAMTAYWIDRDLPEAERCLTMALDATFPRWRNSEWYGSRISTVELENVLALIRVRQDIRRAKQGDRQNREHNTAGQQPNVRQNRKNNEQSAAENADKEQQELDAENDLLVRCKEYIERHVTDSEENAKIYSKYAWIAARMECMEEAPEIALILCADALDRLRQCSIEYFMRPLLDVILECQRRLLASGEKPEIQGEWLADYFDEASDEFGKEPTEFFLKEMVENQRYRCYLDSLQHIHEQFGEVWYPRDSILHNCCQKAWHLDFEILRAERCAQGMTQETAAEGIYQSPREIIKIEQHRRSPRSKRFADLMWKLGLEKERTEGFVVTDSFEVLELRKRITTLVSRHQYEAAKPLIHRLKEQLDISLVENHRTIRFLQNTLSFVEGTCDYEAVLAEDWKLLARTYYLSPERLQKSPEMKIKRGTVQIYRAPMKNEALIINQIAILLQKLGQKDEAIRLYKWVLTTFEQSHVKLKYRYHSYGLLQKTLAAYQCSIEGSKKALHYELICGKAGQLGYNYMTLACALEDDSVNRETCRKMIKEAYYLLELTNNYVNQEIVKNYYIQNYEDDNVETL